MPIENQSRNVYRSGNQGYSRRSHSLNRNQQNYSRNYIGSSHNGCKEDYSPYREDYSSGNDGYRGRVSEPTHRPKYFIVGDMVQITDDQSDMYGKYGLVEEIDPHGRDWQLIIKIGRDSWKFFFSQARFCTRIHRGVDRTSVTREDLDTEERSCPEHYMTVAEQERVNSLIDVVDSK